jgi:glycosyltransferase involved in cell wall biosynthesis
VSDKDRVQILLATYNGDRFLHEQLRSLFNQTHSHIEILASDDNSQDTTRHILEEHGIRSLSSNTSLGCTGNFSKLLGSRNARYIAFCDQDDVWLPEKVESCMKAMKTAEQAHSEKTPILIHTDLRVVDEGLNRIASSFWNYTGLDPLNKSALSHLLVSNNVTGCTILMNEALADLIEAVPKEAIMHDWWAALTAAAFGKIIALEKPSILYRQHGKNTLGAKKAGLRTYIDKIRDKERFAAARKQQRKRQIQAEAFLDRYNAKLSQDQITLFQTVIEADQRGWAHNQTQAYRQGLLRQNYMTRAVGLFLKNPF